MAQTSSTTTRNDRGPPHPDTSAELGAPKPPPSQHSTAAPRVAARGGRPSRLDRAASTTEPRPSSPGRPINHSKRGEKGARPDNDRRRSPPNTTHHLALQHEPQVSSPVTSTISGVQQQPALLQTGPTLRIGPAATRPLPPGCTLRAWGRPKLTREVHGQKRPQRDPLRNRPLHARFSGI
ncbi:hypothetical protein NDU88_001124 [Pleurodeles waltl]|uniref:Uncharacterized protein n=1 Tax=Pleurodeles waltl TaxID=8319 RepID=A0AAV7WHF7_PLEWA|nr:hypothetical protein NDU88_001124 [Pleurodeles waltl]